MLGAQLHCTAEKHVIGKVAERTGIYQPRGNVPVDRYSHMRDGDKLREHLCSRFATSSDSGIDLVFLAVWRVFDGYSR